MVYEGIGAVIVNEDTNLHHALYLRPDPSSVNGDDGSVEYVSFQIGIQGHRRVADASAEVTTMCERSGWVESLSLFHWDGIGLPNIRSTFRSIPTPDEVRAGARY